ncbi:MAG: hypothetical protein AAGI66_06630 [Cyanobacteria bacterium P01_H01_bin.74]
MHVFQIKGFSGFLALLFAILLTILLLFALPTAFMMVLWNALIYESFKLGPEINYYQGFLLWALFLIVFKLVFNPEIHFQFDALDNPNAKSSSAKKNKRSKEQLKSDKHKPSKK